MLKRHKVSIALQKEQLIDDQVLINSVKEILSAKELDNFYHLSIPIYKFRYHENSKRLKGLLSNRPFPVKEILIRHCELAAKFGRLTELDSFGRSLNIVQYYLIDVAILFLTLTVFIVWLISTCIIKCCCRRAVQKAKDE